MSIRGLKSGFTLIELMVVVVIIGIVASLAIPSYTITKERVLDKEAIVALKLMRTANKMFYVMNHEYFSSAGWENNLDEINGNLSLDLNSTNWRFSVIGGAGFMAIATRLTGDSRTWAIYETSDTPELL